MAKFALPPISKNKGVNGNDGQLPAEKPEIEHFINALNDSSQRSRTMLIGIIFASILSFIALINSFKPDWNWFQSRIAVRKVALEWFLFPDEKPADSLSVVTKDSLLFEANIRKERPHLFTSIQDFAHYLERSIPDPSKRIHPDSITIIVDQAINEGKFVKWLFDSVSPNLPHWICIKTFALDTSRILEKEERRQLYGDLAKAAVYVRNSHAYSRKALEYSYDNLIESQSENLQLVNIPILGIAFDINNLGFISGMVLCSLMLLLYLSMVRESRNLKTLFTHGWRDDNIDDRRLYELLSMYQVLTVPLKLYSPDKTMDKLTRKLVYFIFALPVMVLVLIFLYDLHTFKVGASLNPLLTFVTSSSTFLMLAFVSFIAYKIVMRHIRINRQWDNQYYRINLEKLFNLRPDDADINFIWTNPDQVKLNWANTVSKAKKMRQHASKIGERASVSLIEKFIDHCYDSDEEKLDKPENEQQIEAYWQYFKDWFDKNKIKSTRREFRQSLIKLMNGPFEGEFDKKTA